MRSETLTCIPQKKVDLIQICNDVVASHPEVEALREVLIAKIDAIINSIRTPVIKTKQVLCTRTRQKALDLIEELSGEDTELRKVLIKVFDDIRLKITYLYYGEYIESFIVKTLIDYCQTHTAPKQWGLGSIFYFDDSWGRTFYNFWRGNIEKDTDIRFRTTILEHLPESWKTAYKMREDLRECPHNWATLNDEEIVQVLLSLRKSRDPTKEQWWIGSIATGWVDPEDEKNEWGKSFWGYWRRHVEADGDEEFRTRLLPHFPKRMQKNFEERETRQWSSMNNRDIISLLNQAVKPPRPSWTFWDIEYWVFEKDKESSQGFTQYWCKKPNYMELFENTILPHLSEELRTKYARSHRGEHREQPKNITRHAKSHKSSIDDRIQALEDSLHRMTIPAGTHVFDYDGDEVVELTIDDFPPLVRKMGTSFNGTEKPTKCLLFLGKKLGNIMFSHLPKNNGGVRRILSEEITLDI